MSSTQTFNGQLYSKDIYPLADVQYNLGSTGSRWHSLYVGTGSVYIGTTKIGSEEGSIIVNGGITAGGIQIGNSTTGTNMYQFLYNAYGEQEYIFTPYSNTGNGVQTFVPPKGTTSLEIECWGAGGGDELAGGYGGYSYSSLTGLAGDMHLKLWVGDVGEGGKTYYDNNYYDWNVVYIYTGATPNVGVFSKSGVYYIASVLNDNYGVYAGLNWLQGYYNGDSNFPNWNVDPIVYSSNRILWNSPTGDIWDFQNPYGQSYTGVILYTGTEILPNSTKIIRTWNNNYQNNTITGIIVVRPSTGVQYKQVIDSTTSGGGASFVYLNTGTISAINSYYRLTNVAGGGGSSINTKGFTPSYSIYSYMGGNSENNSNTINGSTTIGITTYPSLTGTEIQTALLGRYNTGGTGGKSSWISKVYNVSTGTNGTSNMPLITSTVSSNLSCSGGNGTYVNIMYGFPFFEDYSIAGANRYYYWNFCGGGGGRGFGGGGGGGIYYQNTYNFTPNWFTAVDPYKYSVYIPSATGFVCGGAGGGNYSITGYTYSIGYSTGSLIRNQSNRRTAGLVRIVCKGFINSSITTSPSGTVLPSSLQTSGMSITNSGDTLFNSKVNIVKELEVDGISTFNQNMNILNFQNIFKKSIFDSKLYSIFSNKYNYSTNENTVDLNYALAAMSLEIGYMQNALSGLVQLLSYKEGTYDDSGNLTDIPQYIKLWLRNYFPETTASLDNYVSSLKTSIYPTLDYLYSNNFIIPLGYFTYIYVTQVDNTLLGDGQIGFYIENNKYYIFGSETNRFASPWRFFDEYIQQYAYQYLTYLLNPYNDNISIKTFVELNSPSGPYRVNIPLQLYQNFCTVRGVTFDNQLVYYIGYNSNPQDPNPAYIGDYLTYANSTTNWNIMYSTTDLYQSSLGNRRTYYNFDSQYTGTFSSGTFIRANSSIIPPGYTPPSYSLQQPFSIEELQSATSLTGSNLFSFTPIKKELNQTDLYNLITSFTNTVTSKTVKNTVVAAASKPATTTTSTVNVANTLFTSQVAPVSVTVPRTTPTVPKTANNKTAIQPRP
jgi:hypothetical protein